MSAVQAFDASLKCFARPFFLMAMGIALILGASPQPARSAEKVPEPEEVTLEYKDGLIMKATYYPGTKGKETVPVILLHGYKGSRAEFNDLALYLQAEQGDAVFVPDLRGHGKSTKYKKPGTEDLGDVDAAKFTTAEFQLLPNDIEKMKQFLMEKHSAEALNIDRLALVGSELGADLAVKWSARDWSWPVVATGKQGQDVKALFLISPNVNFKGLNSVKDYDDPNVQKEISIFIMSGKNGTSAGDARQIHNKLKAVRPDPPKEKYAEKQSLFLWQFDTALQGTKLFGVSPLKKDLKDANEKPVDYRALVSGFIDLRIVRKDFRWVSRKLPGQN